jgi:hypothetical protein
MHQNFIHLKKKLHKQFHDIIQPMYLLFKPTFKTTITFSAKLILINVKISMVFWLHLDQEY